MFNNIEKEWIYLFIAGLLEICWAISLKYSDGFTKLFPSIITLITVFGSFIFLSKAVTVLPVGSAYTIWTGMGAVGSCIFGIVLLGEPRYWLRYVFILLIILGVIGLKLTSK